ncbi:MAG: alpha/beta hydrolase [Terrimicrobiaceae bacterium]|nr:alpha/beta hydrolase [Terrimicrobiaceae bacterium]
MSRNRSIPFLPSRSRKRLKNRRTLLAGSHSGLFWCNDDHDGSDNNVEGEELTGAADSADILITSKRDLEDFARLHINIGAFQEAIVNGDIQVGLEWRNVDPSGGSPAIKVYQAAEPDGGDEYLKNTDQAETWATNQIAGQFRWALGSGIITAGDHSFRFPSWFWEATSYGLSEFSSASFNRYLLFEGVTEGKGQLVLTFWNGSTPLGEGGSVWLDIKNIKKMYQRGKAQPLGIPAPHDSPSGPFTGPTSVVDDPWNWPFEKDSKEEKKAMIFVHGWSMDYNTYLNFSETMFKRLWHQGFKGRFCTFRWDPLVANEGQLYAGEYNRSEHRAFLYGQALKQFAETIKGEGYKVTLIGHSMGNVVCGSALQEGLSVENYLLMEAAVPAGCYDVSGGDGTGGVNGYATFWRADDGHPTPDYHNTENGYRGFFSGISSNANRIVNFHNKEDFALFTGTKFGFFQANWEKNQIDYKPDGSTDAIHGGDWRYAYDASETDQAKKGRLEQLQAINSTLIWALTRNVNDPYEMKAFIARPRSKAVGAVDTLFGNLPANMEDVNLNAAPYNFDGRKGDHGGQFNRRPQELDKLYSKILEIVQPPQ